MSTQRFFVIYIFLLLISPFSLKAQSIPDASFSINEKCKRTDVIASNTPPTNTYWYWQTSPTGTNTSYSQSTMMMYASGKLYLRARLKNSPYTWSETSLYIGYISVSSAHCGYIELVGPTTLKNGETAHYDAIFKDYTGTIIPPPTEGIGGLEWIAGLDNIRAEINVLSSTEYSCDIQWTQVGLFTLYYSMSTDDPEWLDCFASSKVNVTPLHPNPIITSTSNGVIVNDQQVYLSIDNYIYDTYQWYSNGTAISGATSLTYTTNQPGNYRVRATKGNFILNSNNKKIVKEASVTDRNYISSSILFKGNVLPQDINTLGVDINNQTFQYFDGLGRSIQSVIKQGSPLKKDIVQPIIYDEIGRNAKKYLPVVVGADGSFKEISFDSQGNYAGLASNTYSNNLQGKIAQDQLPFSQTIFENSPLNRPIKIGSSGTAWQPDTNYTYASSDNTIKFAYQTNTNNEVLLVKYMGAGSISAKEGNDFFYYNAGELYKTKTKDEQQHEVVEYKDKEGKLVLKKVQASNTEWASTYYIYDDLGNLVVVLPPEAVKALTN